MRLNRRNLRKGATGIVSIIIALLLLTSLERFVNEATPLEELTLLGYQNDGLIGANVDCGDRALNSTLLVHSSLGLHDNLTRTVRSLQHYPEIRYEFEQQSLSFENWVDKNWVELSGSAVWMARYQVYLLVNRVSYYPSGNLAQPTISWLRGRLYDSAWQPLDGHTIDWQGEAIAFPRIFDVPISWPPSGQIFWGAEDPRILLEENVPDAEPVIVFNMIEGLNLRRRMYIHRPFSRFTTSLTIAHEEPHLVEKNWSPFFDPSRGEGDDPASVPRPSHHLHLVYGFHPLRVLRCDLRDGRCDWDYTEEASTQLVPDGPHVDGDMRGGTNFVPVQTTTSSSEPLLRLWAGLPRTHLDGGCSEGATYRPELMILASPAPAEFYILYSSDALELGPAVLNQSAQTHPCSGPHIVIPYAIVRWDQRPGHDLMAVSLSVADRTMQVVHLQGVRALIDRLPVMRTGMPDLRTRDRDAEPDVPRKSRWSAAGKHVLECSVSAARNTSLENVKHAERLLTGSENLR
ncbi:glycosyltransferase family 91 protein [Aspergillus aculeatus ATCC 16872]|uniref:Glycosyltransferase family 91 protein n=1 Tax=Aspergillus aculeatus (strain ATCC 16872 / CBS 172.66 / WB 5094) TaxID=690307 RepID=A0A1L9WQ26_ASPA1|nr:glycosyltransferase family 91 protein [Aspergillus aculeatus ATCC 16872]OJJ98295.1 glycosyltransferase family 91 protein [Aspergillus aculeatus ATCC 16872]